MVSFHLPEHRDAVGSHVIVNNGVVSWAQKNKVIVFVPLFLVQRFSPSRTLTAGTYNVRHFTYDRVIVALYT
jgi:hypothetical protein